MWVCGQVLFSRVELKAALDLSFFCLLIHLSPFFSFPLLKMQVVFSRHHLGFSPPRLCFFFFFNIYILAFGCWTEKVGEARAK